MKMICRILLICFLVLAASIAFTRDINLSAYTPAGMFRSLGFSYSFILGYEQNFHIFMHLISGFLITILLYGSDLFRVTSKTFKIFLCAIIVLVLSLFTEGVQFLVGRNVELFDLLMDVIGIVLGVICLKVIVFRKTC